MKWFGKSWGAPACDPELHVGVPVGMLCLCCGESIEIGDSGFLITSREHGLIAPVHVECMLRMTAGSIAHLQKRCSCYVPGSTEDDPPGLSTRQAAKEVFLFLLRSDSQVC